MSTGHSGYDMGNSDVLSYSNKDYYCAMDYNTDIPVVFLMIEKLKSIFTALGAMVPKKKLLPSTNHYIPGVTERPTPEDDPDYRYGDFRDEIRDVEKMRTIGGNYGKKS